jgi:sulfofructose kinase
MRTVLCVGHAVQDFVFTVPALPRSAEKHQASGFQTVGGGPAATAAVAVARLGGRALLAARVGDDPVADTIVAELAAWGVDCSVIQRCPGCSSSLSAVLVDPGGERMIVNYLDPAMPESADWLPPVSRTGAAVVLADSRWATGARTALAAARAASLPGVLDADRPAPIDDEALASASHVAFSFEALADETGESDPVRGLRAIGSGLDAWCCVTVGAEGVFVLEGSQVTHFPGHAVPVVDTLGAGDVWHGAFALGLAEGMREAAAVRFASAAAAIKVQRHGGRAGAPTRADVEELLDHHPATAVRNLP